MVTDSAITPRAAQQTVLARTPDSAKVRTSARRRSVA